MASKGLLDEVIFGPERNKEARYLVILVTVFLTKAYQIWTPGDRTMLGMFKEQQGASTDAGH